MFKGLALAGGNGRGYIWKALHDAQSVYRWSMPFKSLQSKMLTWQPSPAKTDGYSNFVTVLSVYFLANNTEPIAQRVVFTDYMPLFFVEFYRAPRYRG